MCHRPAARPTFAYTGHRVASNPAQAGAGAPSDADSDNSVLSPGHSRVVRTRVRGAVEVMSPRALFSHHNMELTGCLSEYLKD